MTAPDRRAFMAATAASLQHQPLLATDVPGIGSALSEAMVAENIRDLQHWTSALHRNGKPSGVIEAGRHCLPHAVCRTAVQEDKPTLRGHRECVEFDRERNSPFFNRFSAGNRPRHRCPRFVENDPYAIDNAQQSECPQPGQAPHTLPRERRLRLGPPKQTLPQISGIRMRPISLPSGDHTVTPL